MLIVARALQGAAGALLTPVALAVIIATFGTAERGAAIGTWTAWTGVATIAGPPLGGWLVSTAGWRSIFLVNLPLAAVTFVLVLRAVPAVAPVRRRRLDVIGATAAAIALAGPVFALIEQPRRGWGSPSVIAALLVGGAALAALAVRERTAPDPMLPAGLFSRRNFVVGNLETLGVYGSLAASSFVLALFLQELGGWSATEAGLATLPSTVALLLMSRRFGALADRFGPRLFMAAGPFVSAAGLLSLLRVERDVDFASVVLPGLLVYGLGLSMTVAPLTAAVLADAEEAQAGIASAVNNTIARVAGLAAVAALGPLIGTRLDVAGFHLAMAFAAALAAAAGVLGALLLRDPHRHVAVRRAADGRGRSGERRDLPEVRLGDRDELVTSAREDGA